MPLSKAANEKMWDIILTDALEEHCRREVKDLVNNNQEAHVFSKEFERNIRKIRNSIGRKKAIRTAGRFAFKFFTVLACIMGISFGALLTQPTIYASVTEVIRQTFDGYEEYRFTTPAMDKIPMLDIGYIPEDYQFVFANITPSDVQLEYTNSKNSKLTISYMTGSVVFNGDTDYSIHKTKIINGQTYYYFTNSNNNNTTTMYWSDNTSSYRIYAQLSVDELIKIAENIK